MQVEEMDRADVESDEGWRGVEVLRISSASTIVYKWLGPLALAALLVAEVARILSKPDGGTTLELLALSALAFSAAVTYRLFIAGLADAVYDCGSHLQIRRGSTFHDVAVGDIVSVRTALPQMMERVTLKLAAGTGLGQSVTFLPRRKLPADLHRSSEVAQSIRERLQHLSGASHP